MAISYRHPRRPAPRISYVHPKRSATTRPTPTTVDPHNMRQGQTITLKSAR